MSKQLNNYIKLIWDYYDKIPKAVFAAIAVSLALRISGEENFNEVEDIIFEE